MRLCLIVFALVVLLASPPLRSSAATFGAMHWRCIGPFRGGRSVAVTGVWGRPNRFYFGAVGGGVWRTDNAGATWSPIFDRVGVASIGAIAVAASDPNIVYVGTGEADFRSDLQQGNGMYKSLDAGATWQHVGLADTRAIGRISVDPRDARDLVVAALGHPYGPNTQRGVFRSTDGGVTWSKTLYVNADTGAITVARDPQHPATIYAALLQTRRPPWNVYAPSKGPGSGLYVSHDNGSSWHALRSNGFPSEQVGRIGIAVAPSNAHRVYAIVDAKAGGLYRSDDAGASWKLIDGEHRLWGRGWYFSEVTVDPHDSATVYVSNTALYKSTNAGASFTPIKGAPGGDDYHMLWIDPSDGTRMILASDQGVIVSVDGAHTWSSWYNQPTAQLYHIAADTRFPFWVYGAQQDSGAIAVVSRSPYRGISQADWIPLEVGGESDNIAPDPLHPGIVFGSRVLREDLTTRATRDVSPTLAHPGPWRETWTLPLAFSPANPAALYASRQVLFRTINGGDTWDAISGDLTRENPGVPATLDAPTATDTEPDTGPRRGVIYAIAPSPLRGDLLWVGTDDGNIAVTQNSGRTWSNVTPAGLGAWSKIALIEPSHFDLRTAYAVIDRHRLDDLHPYLYRTRDGGTTWRKVVAGLPDDAFMNAVREDPRRRGLLYAGTERGVFVSFDDGEQWESLQLDLPTASVRDLTVAGDALAIATHGRSFWILDDLAPLRQYDARVAQAPFWLYTPQLAYRIGSLDDAGTPLPPESPSGENPPDGASLDYTLGAGVKSVALEITDAHGDLVQRWSSRDPGVAVDPRSLIYPASWVPPVARVETAPGMHRLMWDLHYATHLPPGPDADDNPFYVAGIWAVPGVYDARLTVDGQTQDRQFAVELDPREHATQADLTAQFTFTRAIEALRTRALKAAGSSAADPTRKAKFDAIEAALTTLESAAQSAPSAPSVDDAHALDAQRVIFEHLQSVHS